MQQHTGTFKAQDADGRSYTIFVFTDIIDATTMSGPAVIKGLKEFRTSDGEAVNRLDRGSYLIVGPGIQITSTDPEAP